MYEYLHDHWLYYLVPLACCVVVARVFGVIALHAIKSRSYAVSAVTLPFVAVACAMIVAVTIEFVSDFSLFVDLQESIRN